MELLYHITATSKTNSNSSGPFYWCGGNIWRMTREGAVKIKKEEFESLSKKFLEQLFDVEHYALGLSPAPDLSKTDEATPKTELPKNEDKRMVGMLADLAKYKGSVVHHSDCTQEQKELARKQGRYYTAFDGGGFVRIPPRPTLSNPKKLFEALTGSWILWDKWQKVVHSFNFSDPIQEIEKFDESQRSFFRWMMKLVLSEDPELKSQCKTLLEWMEGKTL